MPRDTGFCPAAWWTNSHVRSTREMDHLSVGDLACCSICHFQHSCIRARDLDCNVPVVKPVQNVVGRQSFRGPTSVPSSPPFTSTSSFHHFKIANALVSPKRCSEEDAQDRLPLVTFRTLPDRRRRCWCAVTLLLGISFLRRH